MGSNFNLAHDNFMATFSKFDHILYGFYDLTVY